MIWVVAVSQVTEDGKYCLVMVFEAKALQLSDFEKRQVNNGVWASECRIFPTDKSTPTRFFFYTFNQQFIWHECIGCPIVRSTLWPLLACYTNSCQLNACKSLHASSRFVHFVQY